MLTIIQLGHDEASDRYIRNKTRAIHKAGLESTLIELPAATPTSELLSTIETVDGQGATAIMVQLPLPEHIKKKEVLNKIPPDKDIDGLNPHGDYKPLTPCAIMRWLVEEKHVDLAGKNVVVFGRSELVGKPIANLLIAAGATVAVCNTKTTLQQKQHLCATADIIISATGDRHTLDGIEFGSGVEGMILVDVGINKDENGELCGDISRSVRTTLEAKGAYITPVPGGVGKWTVAELVKRLSYMEQTKPKEK